MNVGYCGNHDCLRVSIKKADVVKFKPDSSLARLVEILDLVEVWAIFVIFK